METLSKKQMERSCTHLKKRVFVIHLTEQRKKHIPKFNVEELSYTIRYKIKSVTQKDCLCLCQIVMNVTTILDGREVNLSDAIKKGTNGELGRRATVLNDYIKNWTLFVKEIVKILPYYFYNPFPKLYYVTITDVKHIFSTEL
jgi:hypothetical protein